MFALILGAARTRTAQVSAVLALTALVAVAAAAGPWYSEAAGERAAAADVRGAPAEQRTLSVRRVADTDGDPRAALDAFATAATTNLPVDGSAPALGMTLAMTVPHGVQAPAIAVSYRAGFCDHAQLDGRCPAAAGEVALERAAAQQLDLVAGDTMTVRSAPGTEPLRLRVVALYRIADPSGAYWSDKLFRADDGFEPLFTPLDTFARRPLWQPTLAYDTVVPQARLREGVRTLSAALAEADRRLRAQDLQLVDATGDLLATIARDRAAIRRSVLVALGQVLLLGWFAIALATRYTGRDRRADTALLKLRGVGRPAMLRLILGQHLLPMIGGLLLGLPLGALIVRLLAGPVSDGARATVLAWSAATAGAVLAGGLLVVTAVEGLALRLSVATLLRRVTVGRRDWRADLIDLTLLALAAAATYQARSGGADSGVGLIAPGLVALAVAVLLARVLSRVADAVGGAALRAGRLRAGLVAVHVSRQPGTDRVFAFVTTVVAVFVTAAGGWAAARTSRVDRAAVELGASRVLTVQADNRTVLEDAVRRADPAGRFAMAAVVDGSSDPPVLAVDTSRLAAVARWRPEYGPVDALPAATRAARPVHTPPVVTGRALVLGVRNDSDAPVTLAAVLQNEGDGTRVTAVFGAVPPGEHRVSTPVPVCGGGPGCRLVGFTMSGSGTEVRLSSLAQRDPAGELLDGAAFGDIIRWRPSVNGAALDVSVAGRSLRLRTDVRAREYGTATGDVYARAAPLPVPVVLAGAPPETWRFTDPALFAVGPGLTPVRVAGTASVLPVLGATGVLVDLDTARLLAAGAETGGTFQVWLAADAPPSVVDALTTNGLTVAADQTVAARAARLGVQGPAAAVEYALLAAGLALLLAAAAVAVVAAVDREPQLARLAALRTQGLSRRVAATAGYAGPAVLIVTAWLGGLLAAVAAGAAAQVRTAPFTDGWRIVIPPDPLGGGAFAAAAVIALAVLAPTAWLAARPLIRRLSGRGAGAEGGA
ncbi:FtsX-like permease family protein [Mangrovihabitans endophyticus]|uniref:ABC3 transporter permease C-terminal domain-containing protein n=1 Tax=Mangrovihabitans endophyticus TaxID=1751298 RepID=A0A8J3FMM1_9ACTN|nr:FtsX-like permease family protein [Mangrovihabitans endophyticus]GGK84269.1 hypothetical protein GCM10012284_18090 [Mangrovihabitans endophyticus]